MAAAAGHAFKLLLILRNENNFLKSTVFAHPLRDINYSDPEKYISLCRLLSRPSAINCREQQFYATPYYCGTVLHETLIFEYFM